MNCEDIVMENDSSTQFCICKNSSGVFSESDDFGYWLMCFDCKRVIEDSYVYFNHCDGEDQSPDINQ